MEDHKIVRMFEENSEKRVAGKARKEKYFEKRLDKDDAKESMEKGARGTEEEAEVKGRDKV